MADEPKSKPDIPPGSTERIEGPTQGGGLYAIAYYTDARNKPVPKADARSVEIVEYGPGDVVILRTYAQLR